MAGQRWNIGFLLFDRITALDLVGPFEVLSRCEGVEVQCLMVARDRSPVACSKGLRLLPDVTFDDCPPLEVLVVPGGPGQSEAMADERLLAFVEERARAARHVLGVCTGVLLLARAGLLAGRPATTHWLAREELARLGIQVRTERMVWDGKVGTAAGVSSGIDLALEFVARVLGAEEAQRIQLAIEYDPAPPFDSGSPAKAAPELVEKLRSTSRFHQPQGHPGTGGGE